MKKVLLLLLAFSVVFGQNISNILYAIAQKNDLSQKTKEENSGIRYILTRLDIDSLQIRTLDDVLRLVPITDRFNRYGIFDPFGIDSLIPFSSTYVKLYLDNHEIGGVLYGSGLAILGDLDLVFVDHIEIYMQAPSLEISTESSVIIIKLYTKNAKRDSGLALLTQKESKGSSLASLSYGRVLDQGSFYLYGARQHRGFAHPLGLNRDFRRYHSLFSYRDKTQEFTLYGSNLWRGGFMGPSLDARLENSSIHTKFLHAFYKKHFGDFSFQTTFEKMSNESDFYETPILTYIDRHPISRLSTHSHSFQVTYDMHYKKEKKRYSWLVGTRYKYKHQKYEYVKLNDETLPSKGGPNNQKITQFYSEGNIFLSPASIFNVGIAINFIQNEGDIENEWLRLYRLGHTYLKSPWTFKTTYAHIEYHIDPYLMNSFFVTAPDLASTKIDNIFEDIKYHVTPTQHIEFIGGYLQGRNYAFPNKESKLYTLNHPLSTYYAALRYEWEYRPFSKLTLRSFYEQIRHIPHIGSYTSKHLILSNYHTYEYFTFFENIIVRKLGHSASASDVDMGVRYRANNNLDLFCKVDNLFDNGYKYPFHRFNPMPLYPLDPLRVPYSHRRITVGLEWIF